MQSPRKPVSEKAGHRAELMRPALHKVVGAFVPPDAFHWGNFSSALNVVQVAIVFAIAFVSRAALALLLVLAAQVAYAQWTRSPSITVVANGDDPRIGLVGEAIAFWNKTLEELGSGFRLGALVRVDQPIPEEALQSLSGAILAAGGRGRPWIPETLRTGPGDLTIFLAHSEFVSFAGPFDGDGHRVVGIRGLKFPPISLPNVARNVIAHELGHAIGLGHNSDPKLLMCGRPALCRPAEFRSDEPRMFPLAAEEKRQLLGMYPPDWKPR